MPVRPPLSWKRTALLAGLCGLLIASCTKLFDARLKLTGTLELTEHSVGAPVAGRLALVEVEEGQSVTKGQRVAVLDRFEQAERDFRRIEELAAKGGATPQQVEQAQLAMNDQRVTSPVDGVVLVRVHEAGEVVTAGAPVAVIGDRKTVWVRIYVPEGEVSRVDLGQEAEIHVDGVRQPFRGHVTFIATQAEFTPRNVQTPEERVTQTFAVKVTIEKPESYLRPGVSAEVILRPVRK